MDDYISRDAALETAAQYCPDDDGSCSKADADLREMLDEIEAIPAANVRQVVHGLWVKHDDAAIECIVCGLGLESYVAGAVYRFCPFCGADMRELEGVDGTEPPKEGKT